MKVGKYTWDIVRYMLRVRGVVFLTNIEHMVFRYISLFIIVSDGFIGRSPSFARLEQLQNSKSYRKSRLLPELKGLNNTTTSNTHAAEGNRDPNAITVLNDEMLQ